MNLCALFLFPVQLMFLYIIETLRQTFDFGTSHFCSIMPVLFVDVVFVSANHFGPGVICAGKAKPTRPYCMCGLLNSPKNIRQGLKGLRVIN